ncbi:hypothetical protein BJ741DRAFT_631749 [Chytriomyces cf. hyalinus JEL632]|nr:hypothetical protein BJ741DRAFT_631749 [Chytriomyces cf. hyalinus JEL632]
MNRVTPRFFSTTCRTRQQFVLIAKDYSDAEALARRNAARTFHLDRAAAAKKSGRVLMGGATLDSNGNMNGSVLVLDFESIEDARKWVADDVYVTGKVWETVDLTPFRMAPLPK